MKRIGVCKIFSDTQYDCINFSTREVTPSVLHVWDGEGISLRPTHMATLIAAGALNGAVGVGQNRHMVVGMTRKIVNRDIVENQDGSETVIDTESYITAVRTIQPDGTILDLQ